MLSLNYHHLFYFWSVAREGSIARASAVLNVTQPAISAQIRTLEQSLGEKLFARTGRSLVLTDVGRTVLRYADEIFTIGRELQETVAGRPTGRPARLLVGVTDALPKLITYRLLEPAIRLAEPVHLVVRDDRPERLLADLSIHALDVVFADAPAGPTAGVRVFNHLLGECGVSIFGTAALAAARRDFPDSLDGAPFLFPAASSTLRRSLDAWFESRNVRPVSVAEVEDSATLKVFGQRGVGLFAAPTAIERDVCEQYGLAVVGRIGAIRERFYAISVERRITHPAVAAISSAARTQLFA